MVRVRVDTAKQAVLLAGLRDKFDFWNELQPGRTVDIQTGPEEWDQLAGLLARAGLHHTTLIPDLGPLLAASKMVSGNISRAGHSMDWTDYHPLEDMHSYLDYLESTFDFVSTESIGLSYEWRDMRIARVCRGGCGNKPAMWIDGSPVYIELTQF